MKKPGLTLFIVFNNKKTSFKEWHISRAGIKGALIGSAALCLLLGAFAADYFFSFSSRLKNQKYQTENKNLKEQVGHLQAKMKKLNSRLYQIEDFSRKIKVIAGVEHSPTHAIGPLAHTGFPDLLATSLVTDQHSAVHPPSTAPASPPAVDSRQKDMALGTADSLVVYMDNLDKKSKMVRQDITALMEKIYERQDIMRSTPSILPVKGWISSRFGYRKYPFTGEVSLHEGMDIAAFPGTPVYAPADGVVVFAGYRQGYGKVIVIDHGYELSTLYGHLSDIMVSRWQKVERKQVIGAVGNTGNSSGAHLHYEVRISKVPVDPANYIFL